MFNTVMNFIFNLSFADTFRYPGHNSLYRIGIAFIITIIIMSIFILYYNIKYKNKLQKETLIACFSIIIYSIIFLGETILSCIIVGTPILVYCVFKQEIIKNLKDVIKWISILSFIIFIIIFYSVKLKYQMIKN